MGWTVVSARFVLRGYLCHKPTGQRLEKPHISWPETVSGHCKKRHHEDKKHLALEKQVDELPWQNSNQDLEPETEPVDSTLELLAETRTQQASNLDEMNPTTKTNF